MAFEVRSRDPLGATGATAGRLTARFAHQDWRNLLALARRHGFDPRNEYGPLLLPGPGEAQRVRLVAAQELALALREALREETAPRGEAGERQGWVWEPGRGWELEPSIPVGPPGEAGRQVGWAHARQLGELAEAGPLTITRVEEP